MTYGRNMAIGIALFGIPPLAAIGLVLLLNGLDADAGLTAAAFTVVSVAIGAAIGSFADRLPGARPVRNSQSDH
jgi:hypothetical protein